MAEEVENIAKIRALLFGNNLTELEQHVNKNDEFIRNQLAGIVNQFNAKFETIKALQADSEQQLTAKLEQEIMARKSNAGHFENEIMQLKQAQNEAIEQMHGAITALRNDFQQQLDGATHAIQTNLDAHVKHFIQRLDELRRSKVERSALAVLFSDIAMQLAEGGNQTNQTSADDSLL